MVNFVPVVFMPDIVYNPTDKSYKKQIVVKNTGFQQKKFYKGILHVFMILRKICLQGRTREEWGERPRRDRETWKNTFHLLVHSPDTCRAMAGSGPPNWETETQAIIPCFPSTWVGSWIRSMEQAGMEWKLMWGANVSGSRLTGSNWLHHNTLRSNSFMSSTGTEMTM